MLQFQLRADAELYNSCLLFQCNLYTMALALGLGVFARDTQQAIQVVKLRNYFCSLATRKKECFNKPLRMLLRSTRATTLITVHNLICK